MAIYVGSFPLLVQLAGELFPALGSGDLARVLQLIGLALLIFAVQKIAQFGQDALLAGPALLVRSPLSGMKTRPGRKLAAKFHGEARRAKTGDRWQLEDAHDLCPVAGVHGSLPAVDC